MNGDLGRHGRQLGQVGAERGAARIPHRHVARVPRLPSTQINWSTKVDKDTGDIRGC